MATSPEGKAARGVKNAINAIALDPDVFAYIFVDHDEAMQQRAFDLMLACVEQWSKEYEKGLTTNYAVDAMRLRDTMDAFQMRVRS